MRLPDWEFAEWMMFLICTPIVFGWIILAMLLVFQAFSDRYVLENVEAYKSVLQVLTGMASVIVFKVLESWTELQKTRSTNIDKGFVRGKDGSLIVKKVSQHGVARN